MLLPFGPHKRISYTKRARYNPGTSIVPSNSESGLFCLLLTRSASTGLQIQLFAANTRGYLIVYGGSQYRQERQFAFVGEVLPNIAYRIGRPIDWRHG